MKSKWSRSQVIDVKNFKMKSSPRPSNEASHWYIYIYIYISMACLVWRSGTWLHFEVFDVNNLTSTSFWLHFDLRKFQKLIVCLMSSNHIRHVRHSTTSQNTNTKRITNRTYSITKYSIKMEIKKIFKTSGKTKPNSKKKINI